MADPPSSGAEDQLAPLRPTPKPRRLIQASVSLDNLSAPIPRPRQRRSLIVDDPDSSVVKLRPSPPDRSIPDVIYADSLFDVTDICDVSNHILVEEPSMDSGVSTLHREEPEPPPEDITGKENHIGYNHELDSIRIQMEDITANESADSADTDPTDVTLSGVQADSLVDSMIRMGPEWSVPQRYSNSPLVRELAESSDERPRPPSSVYSNMTSSREYASQLNPPQQAKDRLPEPTLLERIIRSHSIWYLPHIGRPAATYLLKRSEPGSFIVRAASRSSCMAISVRLSDGFDMETDHYIIQVLPSGRGVRLENSPFTFQSLPYLLEHYCMRGDELQVRLRLPSMIQECKSTKALQSLGLMGEDFWNIDMSLSRSGSRTSQRTLESTTSFIGHHPHAVEVCHPNAHYAVNDAPRTNMSKKRPSNGRSDPTRFATIHGDLMGAAIAKDKETHSPPTKHEKTDNSQHISRTERRSQSVRVSPHKSANPPPVTGVGGRARRSFLDHFFRRDSSNKQQSPANRLADCQYFVPLEAKPVKSTRSAYDIGDPQQGVIYGDEWTRGSRLSQQNVPMRTFKPISGYEEGLAAARVRPLPMRRERSDLCASTTSAVRLARHAEGSPGPAPSPQAKPRQPMRPSPSVLDPQATRNCVEELRRKRLQSTNEMLNPRDYPEGTQSATASPQISMRQRKEVNYTSWRGRNDRMEHRLSVPNLASEPTSAVMQSAKALKEKLGRNGDGELGTINEGLITPVVRRKQFNQPHQESSYASSSLSSTSSSDRSEGTIGGTVARGRETLEALFDHKPIQTGEPQFRRFSSERRCNLKESELVWRRTGAKVVDPPSQTSQPQQQSQTASNRGSCFFPGKASGSANWSAVNSELKNRQKTRPVPQQRQHIGNRMTVGGMVIPAPPSADMKPSEYAQLTEFAGIELTKQDSSASIRDDDNVSVAGTVFNEPWDSNVWENLLDLAHHGDEGIGARRVADPILEEDSDSDRTAGGSTQMAESEDDDTEDRDCHSYYGGIDRRPLPSDRITTKGWADHPDNDSKFSTMDSRRGGSLTNTLRRGGLRAGAITPPNSIMSLPRAASRFSQAHLMGSLDDLPTTIPSLSPLLAGHMKIPSVDEPCIVIQQYVERLSQDYENIFGGTLKKFIECTVESDEADPAVVARNCRQFINGVKNYLMKHGEGDLHKLIEHERNRLNANQILSIDAILEAVMHRLLLKSVKPHLYHVMVCDQSRTGALEAVAANISALRGVSLKQLGFSNPDQLVTPSMQTMEQIKLCLRKMQSHYSPIKKLENLLKAVALVLVAQKIHTGEENVDPAHKLPAADDLVRWLVFILARTSTVGCEVEAYYMWELLPPHMLTQGDASYYLTALFSAVHVLKSMDAIKRLAEKGDMMSSIDMSRQCCSSPCGSGGDAFLKVAIPDVNVGCIRYATFPGVPQMTTAKLCRVIAHQQGITNPKDYGLYLVIDSFETPLQPSDSPDLIRERMREQPKSFLFAYKRHDAKIAWPSQILSGVPIY